MSLNDAINRAGLLKKLEISSRKLGGFPELLFATIDKRLLVDLEVLDLRNNDIAEVPDQMEKLSTLEKLLLGKNQIQSLPPSFVSLTKLSVLDLSSNQLGQFPEIILHCKDLTRLKLSGNRITSVPEGLATLSCLTFLDLSHNRIKDLPGTIFDSSASSSSSSSLASSLVHLSLSHNALSALPPSLSTLSSLQILNCSHNSFRKVPTDLCKMPSLLKVSFALQKDTDSLNVPACFPACLTNLKVLQISGVSVVPEEVVAEGSKQVIAYFRFLFRLQVQYDPKGHWLSDKLAMACMTCSTPFTFTQRRHHCRVCGKIFCAKCCNRYIQCNVLEVSLEGVRVCESCFVQLTGRGDKASIKHDLNQKFSLTSKEEASFSDDAKKQRYEELLAEAIQSVAAKKKTKESVSKLLAFYGSDVQSQAKVKEQLRELDNELEELSEIQERLRSQIASLLVQVIPNLGLPPAPPGQGNEEEQQQATEQEQEQEQQEQQEGLEYAFEDNPDGSLQAVAMYDYEALNETELQMRAGEVLTITNQDHPEWWYVTNQAGVSGFVPYNYLELKGDFY